MHSCRKGPRKAENQILACLRALRHVDYLKRFGFRASIQPSHHGNYGSLRPIVGESRVFAPAVPLAGGTSDALTWVSDQLGRAGGTII